MRIRIDNADDRAVRRRFIALERKSRLFAATPKDEFALACTNGVERHHRLAARIQIGVQRLHDQELSPIERCVLHSGNHRADDACYLHSGLFFQVGDLCLDLIDIRGLGQQVDIFLQFGDGIRILLLYDIDLPEIQMA